jgi:glycosyltransferase involved in cell wall biosynthesis
VGDGPERAALVSLAQRLGVTDRVWFCGALPRRDALQRLAACHVLVHPSLHDSGGWVCLEGMAAGKPVICLDLGGPAALVTESSGIKVPATDPEQAVQDLGRAMSTIGTSGELRHEMGIAGRRRACDEYIWEKKADRLEALYASVLNGAAAPAPSLT